VVVENYFVANLTQRTILLYR